MLAAAAFAATAVVLMVRLPVAVLDGGRAARRTGRFGPRTTGAALGLLALVNLVMVAMMTMAPVHLWHTGSGLATVDSS